MKRYYCTYFDRNYLVRAIALINSLNRHERCSFQIFTVCLDEITRVILNDLNLPNVITIPLHEIERGNSRLLATRQERSLVEYYWTMTPSIILRLMERYPHLESITYLDADLYFYSSPDPIFTEFADHSILIHGHRFSPELAHLEPGNGKYNVGLLSFRNDPSGLEAVRWWRERCLEWCHLRSEDGKMGDQMYLNDWPERFPGVWVLQHKGAGVAPWNHAQYHVICNSAGEVMIDASPLVFYHFQSFTFATPDLVIPVKHSDYPLSEPLIKYCFIPYIYALRQAITVVRSVLPDFGFGLYNDDPLTASHTFIAGNGLRNQVTAANPSRQLFELDGEWDCYPSQQFLPSQPEDTQEPPDMLWDAGRYITSEDDLLQVLSDLPVCRIIRTLYIIGAHLFQERELINRIFPNLRRIYLFEPIPELYSHLQETTADDRRIRVFPYAIADSDETTSFNITNNHASSSLLHLGKHLEIFPHVAEVASITVECRTLETVMRENALAEPDMLFIDVQGAEYQVLSALSARIRSRVRLIYSEASTEEIYLGSRPLGDIQALLNPEFRFLGFAPLTNDTPTHGNALFVNRNALHLVQTGNTTIDHPAEPATKEYLVSAIVSTYNAERFIRGKLEDLEAQTIADRIEIIVIDSGSLENERTVVEEFQRRYPNVRYIRTDQRETVYQAWNRGIKAATGKFITNANTDDRLRRDAIEVMVNALLANPNKVMAYGDSIVTIVPHETFDRCTPHDYLRWPDFDRARLLDYCYLGPHPVWRREVHDTVGYFDESYQCAADYEFWLRLAMQYEFVHVPELLGLYWQNEGTVSRKGELPIREAAGIQQNYRKFYAEMNITANQNIFPHSHLANKYCTGKGLEIGGSAHNPFGLDTLNVDFCDSSDTIYKQEEVRICGKAMPVDIVASGDDIPLPDESQDFVVSSHVLEHFPNPVKALLEWDRLVRPGGTIFMIVPHKERTFDNAQSRTTLQHIIDDYYSNATEPHPNPQGHDHCWITEDIVKLCEWMIRELGVKWDIVEVHDVDDKVGNGFTIVIQKKETRFLPAETATILPKTAPQSVLFIVHGFPPAAVGGVEVYTRNLALEMTSKGIRMTVLYPVVDSSGPNYSFSSECVDGLTLVKFHVPRGHLFTSILSDEIDSAFGAFLRDHPFDFIHFHHLFDNLSLSMIDVAKKSAVPVAVTLHDFWFICPRAQLFIENNMSVCTGPETPAKCAGCVVLAGWFPDIEQADIERIIAFRHEYVRGLLADVELIFAPSRFVADTFSRHGFGGGKIAVAPLGIGKIAAHRSAPIGAPRFGYMGTIHPVKNVIPLVRAFAATHGEALLHLFGGGEAHHVKELTESIADPRITYHGRYTYQQLPEMLTGIDFLVVPSLIESYCFTVREALSAGIPVLAAQVGGIPEIVCDGVNGLLFDPFDNAELTHLLQQCISNGTAFRKLNGNALPIMTIASDAGFLLAQYATVMHRPALPKTGHLPEISSTINNSLPEFADSIPAGHKPGKIKVAVYSLDSQEHACGHYRIKAPLAALGDDVEIMWGLRIKDNAFVINTDGIESADIIVVQRFLPRPDTKDFLDYLCSLDKPVIYEIDDLLTQLPESNPNHEGGMVSAPKILDFMPRCAAVTVSTEEIKARFSAYNDTIYVLPNMLDPGLWEKPSPTASGPVVIGYAGTNTHGADLELLEEVLYRIAQRYGNEVSFTFMGCSTELISRLPGFRFVQFETTYEAYARKLMEIPVDIMLAPLEDNPFNRCKSNVKWLEYSACGMAGIYSDLPPYTCVKSGETGLLVRNTADDWYNALTSLIDNPKKRRQIARNAREEVMAHYTIASRASIYIDTYKRVLDAHRPAARDVRFSIIIMTWNRAEMLDQCLKALFACLSDPESCEVIVGNNGSTDHSEAVLGRYRIDKYVRKEEKTGLEFYRELFDLAEGEYIIELDDDVIDLPKHFDNVFEEYFRSFPDYGFLGLDVVQNRFTNGAKPDASRYLEDARTGMTVQEGWVIGCCACIKKETFDRIGGFDNVILSMINVEDGVLTERVRKLGLRTGIIKDVKCFHANGPYYSKAYGYIDRDMEKYAMSGLESFVTTYRNVKEEKKLVSTVSIIIPLFNKVEYTRQCMEGLVQSTTSLIDYELILVDNASTDGTPEFLRALSGDVTIITNLANLGFARACNQGARLATGDCLVFLNNDTIPKAGWLEALVDGIEHDGADICGARLLYPNGKVQHAGVAFNEQGIGYHIFNGFDAHAAAVTRKRFMQCVTAACMIMRRDLFHTLSGFDEGYVNGFEDVDLCLRAGEQGKKILYVPDSTLIHFEETSEGRKFHDEPNARRYLARWQGKVRCDDNYFYHLEGFRKELQPDGRIHIFKVNAEQPAPQKIRVHEEEPVRQNRIEPLSCKTLTEKGISLKREGRYTEALEVFSCARNQGNTSVLAHMGDCLANLGKVVEAEAAYLEALEARGDDVLAHIGIGVLKLLAQQYSEAAIAFGKALHGDPASSKALCGLGMARNGQGHKKASYNYFLKALDIDPENITALHELIRTAYDLGDFERAVTHTRNYLMYHPGDLDILFSLAGILYKTDAYDEACDVMERLMALSPEYQGGKELMERISLASKSPDKVAASSENSFVFSIEQGRINKAAGKYDEAFECFSIARKLGDKSVLSEMGDCKANLGDIKEARGFYEEGLLNNADDVRSLVGLGVVSLLEKKLTNAGVYFDKALKAEKENPKALCGLAMLMNMEGRTRDAHDLFTQALDNDPENLTALFELVKCAYGLELFDEAERHLRNYLRYHPADMKILFSLAGVLLKMEKRNEALEQLETILLFEPEFEGAWEMQQMIAEKLPIAV